MNQTNYSLKSRVNSIHLKQYQGQIDNILESIKSIQSRQHIQIPSQTNIKTNLSPLILLNFQDQVLSSGGTGHSSQRSHLRKYTISPPQSRSNLYTRKTDVTPLTIRSSFKNQLLHQYEARFAEYIQANDLNNSYEQLLQMIIISMEQDNIHLLLILFRLSALTFITFKEWTKAMIFLKHCKFLSEFLRRFDVIQWSLLQMGHVCKYSKQYEIGKLFLKKSLEYAWHNNDVDQELICYEILGKLCYLNYDLVSARALHDKSAKGSSEPENSTMREISKQGIIQIMDQLPLKTEHLGQYILSKAVDFPFRIVANMDPRYYQEKQVKNEYLLQLQLECVPSNRVIDNDSTLEEILNQILKAELFSFEIPLPIPTNFKDVFAKQVKETQATKNKKRHDQIKETQMMTFIKIAAERKLSVKESAKPPVMKLPRELKKLPLEQLITERLSQNFNNQDSESSSLKLNIRRFQNLEHIRLNHEVAIHKEHTKKGLILYAQQLLNFHPQQKSNFSLSINQIESTMF